MSKPVIDGDSAKIGIIAYGSTDSPMPTKQDFSFKDSIQTDYLRIRALPFTEEIESSAKPRAGVSGRTKPG